MNYSILFQSPVVGSYFLFHWLFALMWFCASKRLLVPLHTLDYGKCWSLTEVQTAGLGRCTSHLSLYRWASSSSSSSVLFCVHGAQNSNLTNQPSWSGLTRSVTSCQHLLSLFPQVPPASPQRPCPDPWRSPSRPPHLFMSRSTLYTPRAPTHAHTHVN